MMKENIKSQIQILEHSMEWAKTYGKETFPFEEMKEYRRTLRRISSALEENCSAAAYGESQVGKSYLISSLLSTPDKPFVIINKDKEYNFIDIINPSGGTATKTESTGVVTRFTINRSNDKMKDYVKIKNLSIADLVMLLVDSYYNDLKIDVSRVLGYDDINNELEGLRSIWAGKIAPAQSYLTEDDIKDICDYIVEVIGNSANNVTKSDFRKIIASQIQYIPVEEWVNVFSLLWNRNTELSKLFSSLISEYALLGFQTDVYVPFDAVLREKGTLLKIEWLNSVCGEVNDSGTDVPFTDVYDTNGKILAKSYKKSSLSALIAELTFVIPESVAESREFLNNIDLLDFPGARSREKIKEQEIGTVMAKILKRGKVAYLFNKYSRSLRISSVLFCHHNDQKSEPSLGDTINNWIENNVGKSAEERSENLIRTKGISPLFFVATKFNIELERGKIDEPDNVEMLEEHWKRFNIVYPEIIKPATWFDNWTVSSTNKSGVTAFQSIYLLRDFYWSSKNRVFDGYKEGHTLENEVHQFKDYPDYFENLKSSFLANEFVKTHFADPERSWNDVATINNDGSKAIIRDLNEISGELDSARRIKYMGELKSIKEEILAKLDTYYEPEDKEQNNQRVRKIVGDIRRTLDFSIGDHPEIFGNIIDNLMVPVNDIRRIAYDILVLHTKTPIDVTAIKIVRVTAGVDSKNDRQTNINLLCDYYLCDESTLEKELKQQGFTLDDVLSDELDIRATEAGIITVDILDYWASFINRQTETVGKYLPHYDEVAFMLQTLCRQFPVKQKIKEKIDSYSKIFPNSDDLPNAIADFSSLLLDNLVSTIGRDYMSESDLNSIREKSETCNIRVDLSAKSVAQANAQGLEEALIALDEAGSSNKSVLMKLPFWDNYRWWKNLLEVGLLYSSDISHCDPVANAALKGIIDDCKNLYQTS